MKLLWIKTGQMKIDNTEKRGLEFYEILMEYLKDKFTLKAELSISIPQDLTYAFKLYKVDEDEIVFKQNNYEITYNQMIYLFDELYFKHNIFIFTVGAYTDQVHYRLEQNFIEYWCFKIIIKEDNSFHLIELDAESLRQAHLSLIEDNKSHIDKDLVIYRDKNNVIMGMEG